MNKMINLALLSNINITLLKNYLEQKDFSCVVGGYDQYINDFLNTDSFLYNSDFDYVFLFLDTEDLLSKINNERINVYLSLFKEGVEKFLEHTKKNLIINNLNFSLDPFIFLQKGEGIEKQIFLLEQVNNFLNDLSKEFSTLYLFPWRELVSYYGYNTIIDSKFWYLGRLRFNKKGFEILSEYLEYFIKGISGDIKKVLILDLDNTLWGGVVGEDGLGGISLSEDGVGKIYRDFQHLIKSLKNIGILLAIVSKNNEKDVKEVFDNHPMMVLDWEDFIIRKINWKDKATNIKEIALELNLGLESFVFIDDNPVERNLVRHILPEVIVPEFPKEISFLPLWFIKDVIFPYFPKVFVTQEDIKKTKQYEAKLKRDFLQKEHASDLDKYIDSLEIELSFYIDDERFTERTAQQTQKTNQFNLTTRRYTISDIKRFISSKEWIVMNLHYKDRFGDEGVVGTAIIKLERDRGEAVIDTFLLSCRVIGRKVEDEFIKYIMEYLKNNYSNITKVVAEYIPTQKNVIVKNFYDSANFSLVSEKDGIKTYERYLK